MVYNQQIARYALPFAAKLGAMTMLPSRTQTGYKRSRSLTSTVTERKRRKKGNKSFKNRLYDSMAAKHATGYQGVGMTSGTLYTMIPTALPTQGDSNSSRDGDAIVLCGLKLKGLYNTNATAEAYSFRIIVGYTGEEYSNTTFASGLGSTELFHTSTATGYTSNGIINPKAFTCLYDEKFTLNSEISAVRSRVDYEINVPLDNQTFYYQAAASALGKTKNLAVVIVADSIGGTTGTTDVGGTTISWDFIYKNMN